MNSRHSFDHLVGEREQLVRYSQTERLRGFHVEHQIVFGRLHDWQIDRLIAFENTADVDCGAAIGIGQTRSIAVASENSVHLTRDQQRIRT